MEVHDFTIFAGILVVAAAVGLLASWLRQPLIVAFIGVGVLVGPVGLGWVHGEGHIDLLAELGIAILLFLVGLRLDLHLVRTTGPVALATGLGQVVFTSVIGYAIAAALGMDPVTALYVAVALTFSSTIIIVKLLSDKRELDQLHGRIAVGFLIVQDVVVVLAMIAITASAQPAGEDLPSQVLGVVIRGVGLLLGVGLLARYVLPYLVRYIAHSQELLVLFAIALAVSFAAASEWLGFSTEIGAFLAGVSLASTKFREAIGARLVSLRDFLLLFFFLSLGAQLEFADAARQFGQAAVLSVFVLVGNPLIVLAIMVVMRYPARVGFLAGLTVAQISEFSLILVALGMQAGHIDGATLSLVTVVGLVTIGGSVYLIRYSHPIYEWLKPWLIRLERSRSRPTVDGGPDGEADVVLFGLGRFGGHLLGRLTAAGYRVVAVDYDPQADAGDATFVFGSAEDPELLETLPLAGAAWVVSTIPIPETNLALLHALRHHGYLGRVALTAHTRPDLERLRRAGPDLVLDPFAVAAESTLPLLDGR